MCWNSPEGIPYNHLVKMLYFFIFQMLFSLAPEEFLNMRCGQYKKSIPLILVTKISCNFLWFVQSSKGIYRFPILSDTKIFMIRKKIQNFRIFQIMQKEMCVVDITLILLWTLHFWDCALFKLITPLQWWILSFLVRISTIENMLLFCAC